MLNFITNTTQTKLLAGFLGLGIAQVGALSALRARARCAVPPTAAIWENGLCLVDTEPNRGGEGGETKGQVCQEATRMVSTLPSPPSTSAAVADASIRVLALANTSASVALNTSASTSSGRRLGEFGSRVRLMSSAHEFTRRRRKSSRLNKQSGTPIPAPSAQRFDAGGCTFDKRQGTNLQPAAHARRREAAVQHAAHDVGAGRRGVRREGGVRGRRARQWHPVCRRWRAAV